MILYYFKKISSFALLAFLFALAPTIYAQNSSVSGILTDKMDKSSLIGADAVLLHPSDSSIYKGSVADVNGRFVIGNVVNGKYILKVFYLGYAEYFKNIEVTDVLYNAGTILLEQKTNVLKAVEIVAKIPTAVQKNDTTEFNAKAFKTNPDATAEDLVNKVPTISSQNGTVQAQGENVQQILVDGKPYFGGDPNTVLKNFPAEVIDKIQVFDQLSLQSQFTGFNDGNTTKTINIITKPNMRNGTFGKVYGGYGDNDKYRAGGNLSFFKGNRHISIITQSNNINEQNFSSEDLLGVLGGSGGGGGGGQAGGGGFGGSGQGGGGGSGNNSNNFLTTQQNGITKTNAVGLNYTD
ncbi:MAG: TonB-dependent receptor, partial [Candidatus Paceibacterales bacterium]